MLVEVVIDCYGEPRSDELLVKCWPTLAKNTEPLSIEIDGPPMNTMTLIAWIGTRSIDASRTGILLRIVWGDCPFISLAYRIL